MDVKDKLHRAQATYNNNTIHYDAIECLINHLKENNELTSLKVADYTNGKLIEVTLATFLKSKAIPSPMGAFLSAFETKDTALDVQKSKGGELYTWEEIKAKFKESKFGALDHSHHNHHKANAFAPSGIMGDHLHPKGGLMVSLRYMYMSMDGNRDGSSKISNDDILANYMVAPQSMGMQMYMLGAMYAPSDKLTLMVMQNIVKNDMDLTAQMMMNNMTMLHGFSTSSNGLGDMKLSALIGLTSNNSFHLNTSLNIPLGSLDNRDVTPMMPDAKLPYAMQLGSGTFDLTLGGTYKWETTNWSWGIQQLNTLRTGENNEGYRLGNLHELNLWSSYGICDSFSSSIRISANTLGSIKGSDDDLNPMMVPTANTSNYGGEKISSSFGINYMIANTGLLLCVEAGIPLYQNYNGIFMNDKFTINSSIKHTIL
jgi:hypothetical protein